MNPTEVQWPNQQCLISVMDNIADPNIQFDNNGICNYYYEYQNQAKNSVLTGIAGEKKLEEILDSIRRDGKGKPYDCITGASGGVDSSYLVLKAKEWGLRPLIVHFDNGWNSETSVRNINNLIQNTGFDLYTIVVDWDEFKDLQMAYIRASVVDIEVPTDHAIGGTLQRLANKYNLKYILSGNNIVTEAIMPPSWIYQKTDYINLRNIHAKYGKRKLKTYPIYGFKEQYLYSIRRYIETVRPLNFIDFNKESAKQWLQKKIDWKDYGGKHYESVFTRFYQAYILPTKFHIDKRKAHLSNLIFSGQMTKEAALTELKKPLYEIGELELEMDYVLKKFELSKEEFEILMSQPQIDHSAFGQQQHLFKRFPLLGELNKLRKMMKNTYAN